MRVLDIIFIYLLISMRNEILYLKWTFRDQVWKPTEVSTYIPDVDESVKTHLEAHVEKYCEIAQLDVDYTTMYIHYENEFILPPPYIMVSHDGGTIKVSFYFSKTK